MIMERREMVQVMGQKGASANNLPYEPPEGGKYVKMDNTPKSSVLVPSHFVIPPLAQHSSHLL